MEKETEKKKLSPAFEGRADFFPKYVLTFLNVLPRTHFPCSYSEGFVLFCFLGTACLHIPASLSDWQWRGKSAAPRDLGGEIKPWRLPPGVQSKALRSLLPQEQAEPPPPPVQG